MMASLSFTKKNGRRYGRVRLSQGRDAKHAMINLGYANTKKAERAFYSIEDFISDLEAIKQSGHKMDSNLRQQLQSYKRTNPKLIAALEKHNIIVRMRSNITISELIEGIYHLNLKTTKHRTARNYKQAQSHFVRFVGNDTLIADVTAGDVVEFEAKCLNDGYASNTIGNYLKRIKFAFEYAIKKEWLEQNPIQYDSKKYKTKKSSKTEQLQKQFCTAENLARLLDADKHFEWDVLLTIVRWSGCRIAEALILRWEDVDFDPVDPTITFRGKDTEHNRDRSEMPTRVTPLWPEQHATLQKAFEVKDENDVFVINSILNLRDKPEFELTKENGELIRSGRYETNAYQGLRQIMKRTGLKCWPKLFHSIRDFRINEVANMIGITVPAMDEWFGNTEDVRKKHYSSTKDTTEARQRLAGVRSEASGVRVVCENEARDSTLEQIVAGVDEADRPKLLEKLLDMLQQAERGLPAKKEKYIRRDSNPQPSVPKTDALSS